MTDLKEVIAAAVEKGDYQLDVRDGVLRAVYFGIGEIPTMADLIASSPENEDRIRHYAGLVAGRSDGISPPIQSIADIASEIRPAPAADSMPQVGPLDSTEGLKVGDVLRVIKAAKYGGMMGISDGQLVKVADIPSSICIVNQGGPYEGQFDVTRFAFVARPDTWMPWEGGENPVPGMMTKVRCRDGRELGPQGSEYWTWVSIGDHFGDITAYMIPA